MSGFGYGDESLENDISMVEMELGFASDMTQNLDEKKRILKFDLMVFDNTDDYLCYVEAVHLLYHEGIKKKCNFILSDGSFHNQIAQMNFSSTKLLFKDQRVKEYFFVLDNTEYPEALRDEDWREVEVRPNDGSKDVNVELGFTMTYTSNNKYFAWTFIFVIVVIALGVVFLGSLIVYLRMTLKYRAYAKERKEMKQLLLKMKETEYRNFLEQEK